MQDAPPEDRARTISMLKHWDLWPLERRHRQSHHCGCARCFGGPLSVVPDQLEVAAKRRKPKAFFWEEDAA